MEKGMLVSRRSGNVRMKTSFKEFCLIPALMAGISLLLPDRVPAQTLKTLYSFTGGSDGNNPQAGLILSGKTLYGMTTEGGSSGDGTVFAVNTDGTGFTNLYGFTALVSNTNSDGAYPQAVVLVLSGNTLYGTAYRGGGLGEGTVFAVNTDGTGFTNLHNFTGGSDGTGPVRGLVLSGDTLYGTAPFGGTNGYGTVFAVNTDGTGYTILYNFYVFPNSCDGYEPLANLVLSGNTLYGTTVGGGTNGNGTVFAVNTDGTGYTNLYKFTGGSDGSGPETGLILSNNTLYGTTLAGGNSGDGTVFAINTDGTGFRTLHSFAGPSDGPGPEAGLILSGNTLYGTAEGGGSSGHGAVFSVNTDGAGYTNLYNFTGGSDGSEPAATLILSGNTLYGTTRLNSIGAGTVFALSLPTPPQLTMVPSGANVILAWPTNFTGFTLQSATNLVSPVVWTAFSPAPVVVNGQYTVTNPVFGAQMFYRLSAATNVAGSVLEK
jgi:uncharacterized repeat protein (TIGR03803 family)